MNTMNSLYFIQISFAVGHFSWICYSYWLDYWILLDFFYLTLFWVMWHRRNNSNHGWLSDSFKRDNLKDILFVLLHHCGWNLTLWIFFSSNWCKFKSSIGWYNSAINNSQWSCIWLCSGRTWLLISWLENYVYFHLMCWKW